MTTSDFFWQGVIVFLCGIGGCAVGTLRSRGLSAGHFQTVLNNTHHIYLAFPLLVALPLTNLYAGTNPSLQWEMPSWLQLHWAGLSWGVVSGVLAYVFGFCSVAAAVMEHRWKWPVVYFGAAILTFIQAYAGLMSRPNLPPLGRPIISGDGVILQTTPFTCVPAAGANIASLLGVHATERELVELCHTTRDGTFPAQILHGLEQLGITGRKAPADVGIREIRPPAILFIAGDTHAVVYKGMRRGRVELWNPSEGKDFVSEWRLAQLWDGHALEFRRATEQ